MCECVNEALARDQLLCCSVLSRLRDKISLTQTRSIRKVQSQLPFAFHRYYLAAAIYYFVIRATRTLNIGYTG